MTRALDLDAIDGLRQAARLAWVEADEYESQHLKPNEALVVAAMDADQELADAMDEAWPALCASLHAERARADEMAAALAELRDAAEGRDGCDERCVMMTPYRGCTCGHERLAAALGSDNASLASSFRARALADEAERER